MSKALAANSKISHYRILSKLGEGGMGQVWLAEDTRLGRQVALKLLPAEFNEDSERVRRFTQEAKAASALNHPNIISVYDIGECESGRFIVMEFVAGRTLRKVIASDNSIETFFTLAHQMSRALSTAHAAGITHRDIKPDNIMVREDGYVKMLDFGLARLVPTSSDPEAMTLAQQTTPGTVMGTLAYMSPEQASGQTPTPPSDIFALGIVLYELATGNHPFKSETNIGYLHAITSQTPASMSSLKSHLPVALDDLILRMLDKDANQRPLAIEVAQALQEIEKYGSSKTLPIRVVSEKPKAKQGDEGFWVAVLPFKFTGSNPDVATLADGLTEEIVTGLSRFSYLRVISRSSTLRYATETCDVRTVGTALGARYVLEGSLRQAGSKIRLAVQLVDATTGADLWAENYERTFSPDSVFELQDDLVPKIVSTVADLHGVLPRSMSDAVRSRPPEELSPYEAVLRSFGYAERVSREAFAEGLTALEAAVQKAPTYADAWAMLASLLTHDYSQGFNLYSDSLSRAEAAAHKAIELAPHNHLAWFGLANAHFFQKESQSFRHAAERAIALNPMDGNLLASLGESLIFDGEGERGLELVERAKNLNPHHPGWYWYANFYQAYRTHDYSAALSFALKVNLPGHWVDHLVTAAASGQTGEQETADKAIRALLKIRPDAATIVRKEFEKWWRPEDVEHLIEGLRKAGLEIVDDKDAAKVDVQPVPSAQTKSTDSSAPSIAVLPFVNISNDPDNDYFCDGLAEELLNALAKIGDLKVAARTSAFSFKGKNVSVAVIGKTLGVKTVLEGSVRYSAGRVRVAAQLVNIADGYQIWSERYDRELRDVFDIQDEISRAIIDALKVKLLSTERAAVFKRYTENAEAYQLYLKGRYHYAKRTKEDMLKGIAYFRQAIELDSQFALAHAMIAQSFASMPVYPYLSPKEANPQVKAAVGRALELDPNLAAAHVTLAYSLATYDWDWPAVEHHFKQAIAIEPNNDAVHLRYGQVYLGPLGHHEQAIAALERSVKLDPLSLFNNAMLAVGYMHGRQFKKAVEQAERMHDLEPSFDLGRYVLALTYNTNGMYEKAIALLEKPLNADQINQNHVWMLGYAYAHARKETEARQVIETFKTLAQKEYVLSYAVASIYAALGEKDLAFTELERAFVDHDWNLHRLNVDSLMDPLRHDPRFDDLAKRLGLPHGE
jgi:TolB-like protein/Tfp pilus assembly protein PilF